MGENFTYGHKATGDVDTPRRRGPPLRLRRRAAWRSPRTPPTTARSPSPRPTSAPASPAGDMVSAARALGRPHRVDGVVVRGDRRGKDMGYPTANVESPRVHRDPGRRRVRRVPGDPRRRAAGRAASASRPRCRSAATPPSRAAGARSRRSCWTTTTTSTASTSASSSCSGCVRWPRSPDVDGPARRAMAKDVVDTRADPRRPSSGPRRSRVSVTSGSVGTRRCVRPAPVIQTGGHT